MNQTILGAVSFKLLNTRDLIHKTSINSAVAESLRTAWGDFPHPICNLYAVFTKALLTLRNLRNVSATLSQVF